VTACFTSWWQPSHKFDPRSAAIADRHYNRRKVGSPQFVPPGRDFTLRHEDDALWTTSWPYAEFVRHAWPGAWVNSLFRNESDRLSSELIIEAVAHTRAQWEPPSLGIVSFVDAAKTRRKRDPGRCYRRAGCGICRISDEAEPLPTRPAPTSCRKLTR